ncbi:mannitol dehydrogenase family protein [Sphingorhabdus sp.]|uniref:mannitol dehydrogenase family protein n=1 Tax=Sphingorhabdus sp. TaxID=1902408 RepID=UPI0032B7A912
MRLSAANLSALPASVARPGYDRDTRGVGIVHFGIGAFHRAHMAAYTDDAMASGEGDWRILGVSLRSPTVRDQMHPQDGLYTLVERSLEGSKARIIGSVADVLVASEERERLVATLAAATTHIVSFTITEKGYCRAPDGSLDLALADERSAFAYLAEAFSRRRDAGLPGLTLLSCDNLSGNGAQLRRLMVEYLGAHAPDLTGWFENECTCPSTMVDRIVPATTNADRIEIEALLGMRDEAAVVTEPFSQWVIEDNFAGPRPAWEKYGAQITSDVHAYENAKLRMLNGAHSALAYLGLQRGHEFVHQAIADPQLAPLIDKLMRDEAATSLTPAPGQDVSAYADALIDRFKNPSLNHRLAQIAMDGSQKIPQRWLETLAFHKASGQQCPSILTAIGAWLGHIRGDNGVVDDPMAETLKAAWDAAGKRGIVVALFGSDGPMASDWVSSDAEQEQIIAALK